MPYLQTLCYPRSTLISEPDFDFDVSLMQPTPGVLMPFVHLDVYHWSPEVLKTLLRHWPHIRPKLPPIVYAQGVVTDAKWRKFVTRFGFRKLIDCPCSDGITREIYHHTRI